MLLKAETPKNVQVGVGSCEHYQLKLSLSDRRFEDKITTKSILLSLIGLTASGRPVLVFRSKCCITQDVCWEVRVRWTWVTVAMSAMMMSRNNIYLPRRFSLKMTMTMMATMTPVVNRDCENDSSSSPFSTVQVACSHGSRCSHLLLDSVALSRFGLCSNAFPQEWLTVILCTDQCNSVKIIPYLVCHVSLFAHVLLISICQRDSAPAIVPLLC